MRYKVSIEKKALKKLNKMDKNIKAYITSWINKNLVSTKNPKEKGKALQGELGGLWRYRVGNYRIIVDIKENELLILIIDLGHRKDIYK